MQTSNFTAAPKLKAIDRNEIFSRNGKCSQVFVLPLVFSFPATSYQTALDTPIGLDGLARALRAVPQLKNHAVDVAPSFVVGSWADIDEENGFSSVTLARTGDWSIIDLRNGEIETHDLTILNRRIAVRHVAVRVVGDAPVESGSIELPADVSTRVIQMVKFSTMSAGAPTTEAYSLNGVAVAAFPLEPFVSGMFGFNALRTRAILNHVAFASTEKAGADGSMSYEVVRDESGVERICVSGVRPKGGAYTVRVTVAGDTMDGLEALQGTVEHSRALLVDVAKKHGVAVIHPKGAARLN